MRLEGKLVFEKNSGLGEPMKYPSLGGHHYTGTKVFHHGELLVN